MELIAGSVFIGAAIVAVTQAIKYLVPKVNGAVTIGVSAVLGLIVALIDVQIGVMDVTVAQGIMHGLAAAGVVTTASRISTSAAPTVPAAAVKVVK